MEQRIGRGSFARIADDWLAGNVFCPFAPSETRKQTEAASTYMVKQSYMKLNAAGPTTLDTSSGIGGAWFRLPNL